MKTKTITTILTISIIIILMQGMTQAFNDCKIIDKDENLEGYQKVAYISDNGHISMSLENVNFQYELHCDEKLVRERSDNYKVFYYQGDDGMGHISLNNTDVDFKKEAEFGFTKNSNCRATTNSCKEKELCIIKTNDPDFGQVADCNTLNHPLPNKYEHRICCTPTEYCRDGIDNTGNGLIDCQDPQCHETTNIPPQECTAYNPVLHQDAIHQTTNFCVESYEKNQINLNTQYNESCQYEDETYYCSYGRTGGDFDSQSRGACCPKSHYSTYNEAEEKWECTKYEPCGVEEPCKYNFFPQRNDWILSIRTKTDDYCHSAIPRLGGTFIENPQKSEVCCPVKELGTANYYVTNKNIRTFGT